MNIERIRRFRRKLLTWGRRNRRSFPWRETDDVWQILLAEVLLQRSRAITVARVHEELLARWPTAGDLSRARVSSIRQVIRPLGLVSRAERLRDLARTVSEEGVPRDPAILKGFPAVGPYAANATVAVAYGVHAPVVDGVSARVYARFFAVDPADEAAFQKIVDAATPPRTAREWNWAVLDLAAAICTPRTPSCQECPLLSDCAFPHVDQSR